MNSINTANQENRDIQLKDLNLPEDLKKLNFYQCRKLAKEIRSLIGDYIAERKEIVPTVATNWKFVK